MKALKWDTNLILLGLTFAGGMAGWLAFRQPPRVSNDPAAKPPPMAIRPQPAPPPRDATVSAPKPKPPATLSQGGPGQRRGKPPSLDPEARIVLQWVGADATAEQRWLDAINNPILPADERKDLIEDLNEDGLSNIRNPGPSDVPLIESRIRLIERLLPNAMDKVNAEAFKEAHKDLVKMREKLVAP